MTETLPNSIIIPALGNNDCKYHDNTQPESEATFFYDYLYNLWFEMQPSNIALLSDGQRQTIKETLVEGGYYRVDVSDNVSVLALNTLFYDYEGIELA